MIVLAAVIVTESVLVVVPVVVVMPSDGGNGDRGNKYTDSNGFLLFWIWR